MLIHESTTLDAKEIHTTLRALAGLVAHAARQKAHTDADRSRQADANLCFWRDLLLHHTQRLLPALLPSSDTPDYHQFAEELVRELYLEDQEAIADHGCNPLTCMHPAHRYGEQ